eukprot:764932-Hanusia_phi.AAC.6
MAIALLCLSTPVSPRTHRALKNCEAARASRSLLFRATYDRHSGGWGNRAESHLLQLARVGLQVLQLGSPVKLEAEAEEAELDGSKVPDLSLEVQAILLAVSSRKVPGENSPAKPCRKHPNC